MLTSSSAWFTHPMWWFFVASALFVGLMKLLNLLPTLEQHMEEYSVADSERAKRLVDRSYKAYRRLARPGRRAGTSVVEVPGRQLQDLGWRGIPLAEYKGPLPACPDILESLYAGVAAKIDKKVFKFVPFRELEENLPSLVRTHKLVLGSVFPTLLHMVNTKDLRIVGKFMTPCANPAWLIGSSNTVSEWESSLDGTGTSQPRDLSIGVYGRLMSTTVFLLDYLAERQLNWRLVSDNAHTEIRGFDERGERENRVTVEVLYDLKVMMALLNRGDHDLAFVPYPLYLVGDAVEAWKKGESSVVETGINWSGIADYPLNVAVTEMRFLNGSNGNNIRRMLEYVGSVNREMRTQQVADRIVGEVRRTQDTAQIRDRIKNLVDNGMFDSLRFVEDPRIENVGIFTNQLAKLWEYGTKVEVLPSPKLNGQLSERIIAGSELPFSGA